MIVDFIVVPDVCPARQPEGTVIVPEPVDDAV
jgi:hypothetical protein